MELFIRVRGAVGPTISAAFAEDLELATETVMTGEVRDAAALHGVLDRIRDLGLEVLDVHVGDREGT